MSGSVWPTVFRIFRPVVNGNLTPKYSDSKKRLWASGYSNGFAHHRSPVQDLEGKVNFLPSFWLTTTISTLKEEHSFVRVEIYGRISWSDQTQDFKMGSCAFQCDIPHQRIAQQQVGPVSVYCDGMGCYVLCLRHGIPVWQHIGQITTALIRHRCDVTSDV